MEQTLKLMVFILFVTMIIIAFGLGNIDKTIERQTKAIDRQTTAIVQAIKH